MTQSIYDNCPNGDSYFRTVKCDACRASFEGEFYLTDRDDSEPVGWLKCPECGSERMTVDD